MGEGDGFRGVEYGGAFYCQSGLADGDFWANESEGGEGQGEGEGVVDGTGMAVEEVMEEFWSCG